MVIINNTANMLLIILHVLNIQMLIYYSIIFIHIQIVNNVQIVLMKIIKYKLKRMFNIV